MQSDNEKTAGKMTGKAGDMAGNTAGNMVAGESGKTSSIVTGHKEW
jgi:hypothetical protein